MICKVPCYQQELLVQGIFLLNDILLDVRSNCHKNFITLQSVVGFFFDITRMRRNHGNWKRVRFYGKWYRSSTKSVQWFKDAPINNFNFKDLWFITSKGNYGEETTMNIISVGRIKSFPFVITRTQTCDLISDWR